MAEQEVPMDTRDPAQAEDLKKKGNDAMKRGQSEEAIKFYTEAIQLQPDNHLFYSNRCAAYMKLEKYNKALEDASTTVRIKPDWVKGYSRKGAALDVLGNLREAEEVYTEGLKLDPNNQDMKSSLERIQKRQKDVPNPFADPNLLQRLQANEKTRGYLADPKFREILADLAKDSSNLMKHMQDHRVMDTLAALLNIDLQAAAEHPPDPFLAKPGSGPDPSDLTGENSGDDSDEAPKAKASPKTEVPPQTTPTDDGGQDSKDQALQEKEKGNAAYKMKDFATALTHYDRASELDPTNVTFLTNKAAVYFEQGEWDVCIKTCEEAVKKGREHRADFKVIAKALARIGNVHLKKSDLSKAIDFFDHSLAEHRNPDIVKKKNETQKKLKEEQRLAYIDPDLALKEKEKGNEYFKKADYPNAMKHYNEAINRNPDDAKLYSNRALCFQKLLEFPLALKDCDECIRLDPSFVKGYIRKGHALLGIRDTVKAMTAFQQALELDPNNADANAGMQRCIAQDDPEERRKAAMQDPEVQQILRDPAMQLVLQQMQNQPDALRDHLKDPAIASKIQKLIESGFISIR